MGNTRPVAARTSDEIGVEFPMVAISGELALSLKNLSAYLKIPWREQMKKLLSVLFALAFALSVSGFALAADNTAAPKAPAEKAEKAEKKAPKKKAAKKASKKAKKAEKEEKAPEAAPPAAK